MVLDLKFTDMTTCEKLSKESLEMYVNAMNIKDYTFLQGDKIYQTFEDFINSPELEEVHSGFQSSTSIESDMFDIAYVVGKDVYVRYKADGINFLAKEKIGHSLSNGGLYYATMMPHGILINRDDCYDKCENNRKIWRQEDWKTLTSVYS